MAAQGFNYPEKGIVAELDLPSGHEIAPLFSNGGELPHPTQPSETASLRKGSCPRFLDDNKNEKIV